MKDRLPLALPPSADRLALIALQVAAILSSDAVTAVTTSLSASLVGPNSFGYVRPTSALFQSIADHQTHISIPGADDLLVAQTKFIKEHLAESMTLNNPFTSDMRHARDDLIDAVKYTCSFADNQAAFHADRIRRLDEWQSAAANLAPVHDLLHSFMVPQAAHLLGPGASLPLIEIARRAIGWPDAQFIFHKITGFPTVGDYPDTGTFRAIERPAKRAYSSLDHSKHNHRMIRTLRQQWQRGSPLQREAMRIVTAKTIAEVAAGICFGGFTLHELSNALCRDADDSSCFHSLHRFGVVQGVEKDGVTPRVRPCDNAKSSLTNECLSTHETIAVEDASFPILAASLFAEFYPADRLPALVHSTDDVKSAFRVVAALDPGTTVVAIYDTSARDVRFYILPGHNFGLAAAVITFNRHSQLIAAIARRCFGVPCCAYFDDYDCTEPLWAAPSGKMVLKRLHLIFGVPLAEDQKDVPPRPVNVFLGVISDFSRFAQGIAVLRAKPARVAGLILEATHFLDHGMLLAEAKTFFGKCEFLQLSATAGRLGRAALGLLRRWDTARRHERPDFPSGDEGLPEEDTSLSILAREALSFLIFLLWRLPPRTFRFRDKKAPRLPIILYTDGMYEAAASVPARIGVAAYDRDPGEGPEWWHISAAVPQSMFAAWKPRTQYIGPIEVVAPLVALLSCPERFRDRDVILFIDNTGALFGIGKGDSRDDDSAKMIHIFHCLCAVLNVRVWTEYVASGANLADLPSRDDLTLLTSMGSETIHSDQVRFPDMTLSLTELFDQLERELAPAPSSNAKRHRAQVEEAIQAILSPKPAPKKRRHQ
jgi:hypothetical protein